jgi:hypothetical protein
MIAPQSFQGLTIPLAGRFIHDTPVEIVISCDRSIPAPLHAPKDPSASLVNPFVPDFDVHAFDRCPGDAVCRLFLSGIPGVGCEGMIEGFAVDVLTVRRKMPPH